MEANEAGQCSRFELSLDTLKAVIMAIVQTESDEPFRADLDDMSDDELLAAIFNQPEMIK